MTKTICFWCNSGPLKKPIVRIPLIYPSGDKLMVPVCRKCEKFLVEIEVQCEENPHLKVYYIPILKVK